MSAPRTERRGVLRGTARRVLIVPQSGDGPFEQVIFIVRDGSAVSEAELLREALDAAGEARPSPPPRRKKRLALLAALASAAALAAILLLILL